MPDQPGSAGTSHASCPQCASTLPAGARFCTRCGHILPSYTSKLNTTTNAPARPTTASNPAVGDVRAAGRAVRSSAFLLDLAVMVSPALPLSIIAATSGVAALVYLVFPVAFLAVWVFMQTWQGLTGTTFGKAMLGLRLVRVDGHAKPGVGPTLLRSIAFGLTLGLAALPMSPDATGQAGAHDRISGLGVLDVTVGANPLGAQPQPALRRVTADRGLNRVHAPVPVSGSGQR